MTVRGTFRRDLELASDGRGPSAFRLRHKPAARAATVVVALIALGAGAVELWNGVIWAIPTLLFFAAFVWQLVRAELAAWHFEHDALVRHEFTLGGVRELRVPAAQVRRVEVARARGRARAWIETNTGELYALLEGDEAQVDRVADSLSRLVLLASAEPPPPSQLLH